jgi:hypothetical protein
VPKPGHLRCSSTQGELIIASVCVRACIRSHISGIVLHSMVVSAFVFALPFVFQVTRATGPREALVCPHSSDHLMICRLRAWLLHELPPSGCNVYTMRVPLRFGVQCLFLARTERARYIKPFHSLAAQVFGSAGLHARRGY